MTKEVTDPYSPQLLVWPLDHDDDEDGDDDDNHDNDDDPGYSQVYRNASQLKREGGNSGQCLSICSSHLT